MTGRTSRSLCAAHAALAAAAILVLGGCSALKPSGSEPVIESQGIVGDAGEPRNRAKIHTELASLYYGRGNMAVALEELRIATSADANYAPAYSFYGLVYMELREAKLAQENFERALRDRKSVV